MVGNQGRQSLDKLFYEPFLIRNIMRRKLLFMFIALVVGLILYGCKERKLVHHGEDLVIRNNSGSSVYFYIPNVNFQYPDTALPNIRPNLKKVLPSDYYIEFLESPDENSYFDHLPANTLSVYFFDASVFENLPWDSIKANYNVLIRMDLSVEDIQSSDLTVAYP